MFMASRPVVSLVMTGVDIEYCVPCGHLETALDAERALLEAFGEELAHVRLTPDHGGVFKIHVDDELVYDNQTDGPNLDLEAVKERIRETDS